MSVKLQVIVPIYPDPLLCQLYFRNYVKYKQQYVDRLIIITKSQPIHSRTVNDENGNVIRCINYDLDDHKKHLIELQELLTELKVKNYTIKYCDVNDEHGVMFHTAMEEIYDENYHTFFDEQDAYWLNDNFKQIADQLNEFDLIGGVKSRIDYLDKPEHLEKFNKKFGVNHKNQLFTLHLPEFLSNRIIKQIENFSGKSNGVADPRIYCDEKDMAKIKTICLDTFQTLNINIYKKTDRVKLIPESTWDMIDALENKKYPPDYENYILYHLSGSSSVVWMTLFNLCELDDLKQNFADCCRAHGGYQFRHNFLYQSIDRIPGFKYITAYKKNIENASMLDVSLFSDSIKGKPIIDLAEYNCYNLIERIL